MTVEDFYKIIEDILTAKKMREPKRPLHILNDEDFVVCGTCGGSIERRPVMEHIMNGEVSYCEHCGQAIDWSGI